MVSADAGTVTVQYTRHSHHHRIKSSNSPGPVGPPLPLPHYPLSSSSCFTWVHKLLGYEANTRGNKKIASDGAGWGGPASRVHGNSRLEVNGDFFLIFFIAHRTRDLSWHKGKGLVMMRFFVHYTVYYTSLAFLSTATAAAAAADHR